MPKWTSLQAFEPDSGCSAELRERAATLARNVEAINNGRAKLDAAREDLRNLDDTAPFDFRAREKFAAEEIDLLHREVVLRAELATLESSHRDEVKSLLDKQQKVIDAAVKKAADKLTVAGYDADEANRLAASHPSVTAAQQRHSELWAVSIAGEFRQANNEAAEQTRRRLRTIREKLAAELSAEL